jgi:hypothetical protein
LFVYDSAVMHDNHPITDERNFGQLAGIEEDRGTIGR